MKNKIKLTIGLVAILTIVGVVLIIGCISSDDDSKKESAKKFFTYKNPDYGIKMEYSRQWVKKDDMSKPAVVYFSPEKNDSEFHADLIILVQSSNSTTLDEITSSVISAIEQNPVADIIHSGETTLANNPAHMAVYTVKLRYNLTQIQVWTQKSNKTYIILYVAKEDEYLEYIEPVKEMIDSFEITDT